ncbi:MULTISPECIES: helix-turn-helix domain-containing protein [Brevibacterium]|jgi:quercetin dioxygenase-like cupin family protein/DNA-binding Xre family transcriptional regulator|uniref:Cupin domain-containing protein n=1 Tax=Brevibacterium salitolerans TaxID=1403566 RepID=A0ABN2X4F7_9MICO|nr:cupin domain-containing protein [Brevibacterium sp.]
MRSDTGVDLLGARLRTARLMQRRSMRELAREAEISVGHLSGIESGKANASVATISGLCRALGITVGDLFAPEPPPLTPVRGREREVLRADECVTKKAILKETGQAVDIYEVDLRPGGSTGGDNRHPGCSELIYVLEGEVTVRLDHSSAVLEAGDSIHFPSEVEHEFSNTSDSPARIHWVVVRQKGGVV